MTKSEIINLIISCLGLLLGGAALWVAIFHIRKARTAAEAAEAASKKAITQVSNVGSIVDLGRLINRANEVVLLLRAKNYSHAAVRAYDLIADLAQARYSMWGSLLIPDEVVWQQMITNVSQLHENLMKVTDPTEVQRTKWLKLMTNLHVELNGLAARASISSGVE